MTATTCASLTTTMWVIYGVHNNTADSWADTQPTTTSSLTDIDACVVVVSDNAYGGATTHENLAKLTRGQTKESISSLFCHQLSASACGAYELPTLTGFHLDVVNHGTQRHCRKRHGVSGNDIRRGCADYLHPRLEAFGSEDVSLLSICIMKESDARRSVWIVFYRRYIRGYAVLIALEVNKTVPTLMSTATMAAGDTSKVVAATRFGLLYNKLLMRLRRSDLIEVGRRHVAATWGGWLVLLDAHYPTPSLCALEEIDELAVLETDRRFLPVGSLTCVTAQAFDFAAYNCRTYIKYTYVKDGFDGLLDLWLGRSALHLEGIRALFGTLQTLLSKKGSANY